MTARRTDVAVVLLVGVVLAVLGWNELALYPRVGLDASWGAALYMANGSDLGWGTDLVFTYGPIGFLKGPAYWYENSGALAVLYILATRVALAAGLWHFGRRTFGSAGAALIALVVAPMVANPLPPLVFAWGLWLVTGERTRRQRLTFAIGAGALGGLELLGKINIGVLVVALGAIAVLFAPRERLRLTAIYAGSTVGGLLLGWVATGQRLLDLNDYLVNSARVASGYSTAMVITVGPAAWQYTAAAVVFGLFAYACWSAAPFSMPRARAGALLLAVALSWMTFKSGYVRHDPPHSKEYFGVLLPALVMIPYRRDLRAFAVAAVAAGFLIFISVSGDRIDRLVQPLERAGNAWADVKSAVRPGERERRRASGYDQLRAQYHLSPDVLEALKGHTVHVAPYETSVAWAYGLDWKPEPIFHSYQAYTAELDRINADSLLASDAPGRILLGTQESIDHRFGGWDPPATTVAMLCRYQPLVVRDGWLVLGQGPNRCGEPRRIASRTVRWGEPVPVPPESPEGLITVKVHGVAPGFGEKVRAALFKGYERYVSFDGGGAFRLVPETAENEMLVHAPPGIELPEGFGKAPHPKRTIAIDREGDAGGTLRYEFFLVPVRP
ncbi:MAG TPA: hypothetical protein VF549_21690 [Solirubrobacteraceae bacterium]